MVLKGIFSGLGALAIALIKREVMPELSYVLAAMLLGFVAYGLHIYVCTGSKCARGCQNKRLLRSYPICWSFFIFCVLA